MVVTFLPLTCSNGTWRERRDVKMDRAGAAGPSRSEFCACEFQVLAHPKRRLGLGLDADRLAVDRERNCRRGVASSCFVPMWIVDVDCYCPAACCSIACGVFAGLWPTGTAK